MFMIPEVSVIVPVYNAELYLDTCIHSILTQDFCNFELLLIDDGSTDKSGQICDGYSKRDKRILVVHQQNGGISVARNAGLKIAKGSYIAFVDSDDYIPSTMISDLLLAIKKTGADMAKGNYQKVYDNVAIPKQYDGNISILTSEMAIENFLCEPPAEDKKMGTVVWNALYRKALFETISFPDGLIYEDGYVTPKLLLKSTVIAHLNKVVYFYRQNPDGIMGSGLTELALKSIDDQKENHYLITNYFPQFAPITCKRWIDKYIDVLYALRHDNGRIAPSIKNEYIGYIRRNLVINMRYFLQQGIPPQRLFRIYILCLLGF